MFFDRSETIKGSATLFAIHKPICYTVGCVNRKKIEYAGVKTIRTYNCTEAFPDLSIDTCGAIRSD